MEKAKRRRERNGKDQGRKQGQEKYMAAIKRHYWSSTPASVAAWERCLDKDRGDLGAKTLDLGCDCESLLPPRSIARSPRHPRPGH